MRQVARAMPLNSMKRSESRRGTTRDDAGDSQDLDRLFERQIFCHQTSVSRGISVSICAGLIQSVSRAFAKIGSRASNHPPTRVCPQRLTFLHVLPRIRERVTRRRSMFSRTRKVRCCKHCEIVTSHIRFLFFFPSRVARFEDGERIVVGRIVEGFSSNFFP